MSSKINVLIPDGCSTWALTVMSCLAYNSDYKFFVLSNSKRTATKFSKFTFYYKYYQRPQDDKLWLEILKNEINIHNISVLVPVAESEIRFCLLNHEELSRHVRLIPLPSIQMFEIAIDKYKLGRFLKEHHLPYPKFIFSDEIDPHQSNAIDLNFPILSKPLHAKGGDGIIKFDNVSQLNHFLSEHAKVQDIFLQEYIDGFDIDCSVMCLNGEIIAYTIQKGDLEGDTPYAPQLGFEFKDNKDVLEIVKKTMKTMNWSGLAHVDLRYDSKIDVYKIIEINARFWGSIDGSRVAGINFPDLTIKYALQNTSEKVSFKTLKYMRLKGALKSIKRKPSFIFRRNFIMQHTEVESFLRDPLPTGYKFVEWLGRRF